MVSEDNVMHKFFLHGIFYSANFYCYKYRLVCWINNGNARVLSASEYTEYRGEPPTPE